MIFEKYAQAVLNLTSGRAWDADPDPAAPPMAQTAVWQTLAALEEAQRLTADAERRAAALDRTRRFATATHYVECEPTYTDGVIGWDADRMVWLVDAGIFAISNHCRAHDPHTAVRRIDCYVEPWRTGREPCGFDTWRTYLNSDGTPRARMTQALDDQRRTQRERLATLGGTP